MCGGVDQMRFIEILDEDSAPNTLSSSLKKQADMKSDQAKKLKKQASVQKKREQVNRSRSSLLNQQSELTKILSST